MTRAVFFPAFYVGLFLLATVAPQNGLAQDEASVPPEANPADVESVDAIIEAVYDVISGPAGEARDWDRFRSLFLPGARLIPTGGDGARVMTPEGYAEGADAFFMESGFFETEIGRVEERFGPIAHLFSAYQSKRSAEDPEPFARGINSFQLMHDGDRWWVVTIFWASERADLPIPQKYLNKLPG
jgi:hypothetical protein